MGNYLILSIAALTFIPIVFGILLGLLRGSRRALLRLILVVLSVVLAFALCGTVADVTVTMDVSQFAPNETGEPMTVADVLAQMLGEGLAAMGDFVIPLMQSIVKIILFFMLFLLFQFITWILIYPICKIFVKPKKVKDADGNEKKKRNRLLGAVFGLVQGVVVALVVCIVVNGFFAQGATLVNVMDGMNEITQEMPGESTDPEQPSDPEDPNNPEDPSDPEQYAMMAEEDEGGEEGGVPAGDFADLESIKAMFAEYNNSIFGKMYNAVGSKPFELISRVKTADGRTITLSGQIDALDGLVKIGKEFIKISDINFNNFYEEGNIKMLTDILKNVESIRKNMSKEAGDTVNYMIGSLSKAFGLDLDILNNFARIDLAKEAEAFEKLSAYKDKDFTQMTSEEIQAAAKDIVESIGNSDLMLDMLAQNGGVDLGSGLSPEQLEEINQALDSVELSAERKDMLRDIFNLKNGDGESQE